MTDHTLQALDWTSIEAAEWKSFLRSKTGEKFLQALALEEPELLDGGDVNRSLVRSGEVRQHKILIAVLLSLANEPVKYNDQTPSSSYPPLDDDSKWNDGLKLR